MKVLFTYDIGAYINPYVQTLYEGLLALNCDITCSLSEFWDNYAAYDIIHIQWPNILVDNKDVHCKKLKSIFIQLHEKGKKIICTCHNIAPHYTSDKATHNTYRTVYESCDFIQHLGFASIQLIKEVYPNIHAEHVVVPHHVYDTIYNFSISKEEARKRLGIPMDKKVILSFGAFRDDEERELVINLSKKLNNGLYYFLVPGFFHKKILQRNIFKAFYTLVQTLYYNWVAREYHLHISQDFVPNEIVPFYMVAADVMLIQRVHILNSGNVPLAMYAGLPIVGPNDGNVEVLLRDTGNYIFDKTDTVDIDKLVEKALKNDLLRKTNREYAISQMSTGKIAKLLLDVYYRMIQN